MVDLWPEQIDEEMMTSPVSILREQAHLLGEKTKNIVKAEVNIGDQIGDAFLYHFYIVAPTLNNYHYHLFTVEHDIALYPLKIYLNDEMGSELKAQFGNKTAKKVHRADDESDDKQVYQKQYVWVVASEFEFVDALKEILASRKTRQVIAALRSQVPTMLEKIFQ